MTTRMRSQGRGLPMSLLALTASASVVGAMFVSVAPAYSVDGIGDVAAQCLTVSEAGASIVVSSNVPVGSPLHVEGSGWGASTGDTLGFVVVTLDDGQEVRPDGVALPSWVPASVERNKSAWAAAKVDVEGVFSIDFDLPAAWAIGSSHRVMIGDGVTGNYVQVEVSIVEATAEARSCTLKPTDGSSADAPDPVPGDNVAPTADSATDNAPVVPSDVVADDASPSTNGEPPVSASQPLPPVGVQARTSPTPAASDAASPEASPSASTSSSSVGRPSASASSSSSVPGSDSGADPTAEPSTSSAQQSVSASQIGPKAHSEQQASNQAAREQESRLYGWVVAGGGLLVLLGAIVTVSIVRRSHGLMR